jgi:hypothetical protein
MSAHERLTKGITEHREQLGLPLAGGARATDPATSHAAADSLDPFVLHKMRRHILGRMTRDPRDGLTAWDLTLILRRHYPYVAQNSVAKRLSDLRDAGMVEDTGTTRDGSSSRQLTVWRITADGRKALAEATAERAA